MCDLELFLAQFIAAYQIFVSTPPVFNVSSQYPVVFYSFLSDE